MKKMWLAIVLSALGFAVAFLMTVLSYQTEEGKGVPFDAIFRAGRVVSGTARGYLDLAKKDPRLVEGDALGGMFVGGAVFVGALRQYPAFAYVYFASIIAFLLLDRRKKEKFGIVYDALTKKPVDLAVVRLLHADGRPFRTTVSDIAGRYAFFAEEGEYRIEVLKNGFKFPSRYEWGKRRDGRYLDLYHGELFRVGSEGAHITRDIPLAPAERKKSKRELFIDNVRSATAQVFSIAVMVLSVMILAIYRDLASFVMFVGSFILFWIYRYGVPRVPKSWGIVFDKNTGKPIPNAVVRIFEGKYKKALDYRLTDSEGRYHFLAGNNSYLVTAEKAGYTTSSTVTIDLTGKHARDTVISVDIGLAPVSVVGGAKLINPVVATASPPVSPSTAAPLPPSATGGNASLPPAPAAR